MWVDQASQIVAAFGGVAGLGTWMKASMDRRASRANAAEVVSDTAVGLLDPLKESVEYLKTQLTEERAAAEKARAAAERDRAQRQREAETLRAEVAWLREYVAQLVEALHGANVTVPEPPAVPATPPTRRRPRRKDPDADTR